MSRIHQAIDAGARRVAKTATIARLDRFQTRSIWEMSANSSLLSESQAKMKSLPDAAVLPGERQLSAQGFQGIAYDASAIEDGTTVHYSLWVARRNGYNYNLAVYSDQKNTSAIGETMRSFLHGIRQVEPNEIARKDADDIKQVNARQEIAQGDLEIARQIKFAR